MRRLVLGLIAGLFLAVIVSGPALACGGLVAPNGAVNLVRTSTLAAYHDGIEHYVTSFEFTGRGGESFGSIVPLPGVPSKVQKGGAWTLQRLQQEVQPVVADADALLLRSSAAEAASAEVIYKTRIDALDVTILKGGGDEVGTWARENGFSLPPDAPEVLDFYAARSPIFMAARFDVAAAKQDGFEQGDGTPVHVTIPTPNPWVPLRILGLGKQASETVEADVFLLTDGAPAMLPAPVGAGSRNGLIEERKELASDDLLRDLRSDRGMGWIPRSGMWLTYLRIDTTAGELDHDLAIDQSGFGDPSPVAAGLTLPRTGLPDEATPAWAWALAACIAVAGVFLTNRVADHPTWRSPR